MTTLADRLKAARESLDKGQKDTADQLGISFRSWQDYELGKSVPGGKVFESLSRLGFNANWLLTGEGPMRRGYEQINEEKRWNYAGGYSLGDREDIIINDEYIFLPLYDVRAAAGGGALVDTEQLLDVLAFKSTWIRAELRANPANLYLIYVEGESMEPTLRPGDLILVDRSEAIRDGIFVLRLDDGLLVKRLQRLPGNQVKVTSDNPAYEPFTIDLGNPLPGLAVVGRVVWSGRRM